MCSQEKQQDDTQSSPAGKLGGVRKLERGENNQISDHRYFEKVFKKLRKKLNLAVEAPVIGIAALKTNALIWGLFMSTTMKAAIHLRTFRFSSISLRS